MAEAPLAEIDNNDALPNNSNILTNSNMNETLNGVDLHTNPDNSIDNIDNNIDSNAMDNSNITVNNINDNQSLISSQSQLTQQSQSQSGRIKKVTLILKPNTPLVEDLHVRVKLKTEWAKVFQAFSDHSGQAMGSLRFLYDGERITPSETPTIGEVLTDITVEEANEGIQIDAMMEQTGGMR